jgi:hypothetical protein
MVTVPRDVLWAGTLIACVQTLFQWAGASHAGDVVTMIDEPVVTTARLDVKGMVGDARG